MPESLLRPSEHLCSDLSFDVSAFETGATSPETVALNERLIDLGRKDTKWWKCGSSEYRRRRAQGQSPFPRPVHLSQAENIVIESEGRSGINCRVFKPDAGQSRGVFYHIHGGGYVLGSADGQDLLLAEICRSAQLVVVSVEYRLAPEHPYPAALDDCCTVARWIAQNAQEKWYCGLMFIGGESAGATLSALVLLHLREEGALSSIKGIVLNYGQFDLSALPSLRQIDPNETPILNHEDAETFLSAYLPGLNQGQRKAPTISPAYNKLNDLVPALFLVGTKDGLVDDSILMASRWQLAGNQSILKFVPGACHGFMTLNGHLVEVTRYGWDLMLQFLNNKSGQPRNA